MPNHKSAEKRVRQSKRRTLRNRSLMNRVRTFVKRVEVAIKDGKAADAHEALKQAQPELHRGVSKGILKKNTASRKLSRLSARIRALDLAERQQPGV